jgi:adenylate kinase family enzyme
VSLVSPLLAIRWRMTRYLLIGNSGSGKSTLAARLARAHGVPHLDLDVFAWEPRVVPPMRRAVDRSARDIVAFMGASDGWVIEGCYADLAEVVVARCTTLLFLNPGVDACVANARARPWEPHKYATKEEQDAGLEFLIGWIAEYATRRDVFSLTAHRALFDGFPGEKAELTTREAIAAFPESPLGAPL